VTEALGYPLVAGYLVMLGVGGALVTLAARRARRGDEVRAFTLAIAAVLALTPILWWHYLALLVVPLALTRPRFSAIWLLPIAICLARIPIGDRLETSLPLLVASIFFAAILTRPAADRLRPALRPALQPAE
jgi:hypothetical protein